MAKKPNVVRLKKVKKKYQLTDAKIKSLPTRTLNLDNWKEETFWSNKYEGLGIRRQPKGKREGLPQKFIDAWVITGTPKGHKRNIRITGADPHSIKVKEAVDWYKDQKALMQQGINPTQQIKESRNKEEPTVKEIGDMFLKQADIKESTKKTYKNYLENRINPVCGNKSFSEITDADIFKLIEGSSNNYKKNLFLFFQSLEKRLEPRYKKNIEELLSDRWRRLFKKLPPTETNIEQYLAYEPHNQQLAQFFLALQYASGGYLIKKDTNYREHRIDIAEMADPYSSQTEKEKERLDLELELAQSSRATEDTFLKPTIENRSVTDLYFFILLTGLRRVNICDMEWKDINWKTNTLIIPKMKNQNKPVEIRLTNYTRAILEYRQSVKQPEDVYVFLNERTRKKLNLNSLSNMANKIPLWACLLDYTTEYPNIRSLTLDRPEDQRNPETHLTNPIAPLMEKMGKEMQEYNVPINVFLERVYSKLRVNLQYFSVKKAEEEGREEECFRYLTQDLGFNPHGLRRTASNIARLLRFPTSIFLRHSDNTASSKADQLHYSQESPQVEQKQLAKCHNYLDNRIFESLGKESDMNETHFLSPILSYYGKAGVVEQDEYFDFNRHSGNVFGEEKDTIEEVYELKPFPTELN